MAKLLWALGALAAFLLVMFAVIYYVFADLDGGASSAAPAFGVVLAGLLIFSLSISYKEVFRDTWPN